LSWTNVKGILHEFLQWMMDNNKISIELYDKIMKRAEDIINYIKNNEAKKNIVTNNEFGIDRFFNLDEAQKAFVIYGYIEKELKFISFLKNNTHNFKILANTIYLNLIKNFSDIYHSVINKNHSVNNIFYIKNYIRQNPKIKKLGCGKFSTNYHKHIKNLMHFLNASN